MKRAALVAALMVLSAACQRDGGQADQAGGQASPPPAQPAAQAVAPTLGDIAERGDRYAIGISFAPVVNRYPGLAKAAKAYADDARADLLEAVRERGDRDSPGPYDLSLMFNEVLETPTVVAIAAEGSSYTGGAHGNPLVARFVWLPGRQELLTAQALIPESGGWKPVSDYVREQLHAALSQRIDGEDAAEHAERLRSAGEMIEAGTTPEARNFAQFEPIPAPGGRLAGLRFVFPPYQVGPYSDGTQTVDVPASVLLPVVAPQYHDLFVAS